MAAKNGTGRREGESETRRRRPSSSAVAGLPVAPWALAAASLISATVGYVLLAWQNERVDTISSLMASPQTDTLAQRQTKETGKVLIAPVLLTFLLMSTWLAGIAAPQFPVSSVVFFSFTFFIVTLLFSAFSFDTFGATPFQENQQPGGDYQNLHSLYMLIVLACLGGWFLLLARILFSKHGGVFPRRSFARRGAKRGARTSSPSLVPRPAVIGIAVCLVLAVLSGIGFGVVSAAADEGPSTSYDGTVMAHSTPARTASGLLEVSAFALVVVIVAWVVQTRTTVADATPYQRYRERRRDGVRHSRRSNTQEETTSAGPATVSVISPFKGEPFRGTLGSGGVNRRRRFIHPGPSSLLLLPGR